MDIVLSPAEVRVLGALVEKELATPEYYPLSLNSLVAACNQKSNRDPVMSLSENDVNAALDSLRGKNLAWQLSTAGGRVPKFEHNLLAIVKTPGQPGQDAPIPATNDLPSPAAAMEQAHARAVDFNLFRAELSVLCVLMLRGPLTVGEIRTCTGRMHVFKDLPEVEQTLQKLIARDSGPLVAKLARETGKKEHRFAHLFSGALAPSALQPGKETSCTPALPVADRLSILEQKIGLLTDEFVDLKQAFNDLKKTVDAAGPTFPPVL